MYCGPARQFIEGKGGSISLSERVEEIKIERGRVVELKTDIKRISDFDFIICAIPFYSLEKIIPLLKLKTIKTVIEGNSNVVLHGINPVENGKRNEFDNGFNRLPIFTPQYSSILNVHVWLNENFFGNNFYALINSRLHWVFCHDTHLTCVISDADYLMNVSDDEIMNLIYSELEKYLNIKMNEIQDYFIIKEKRATFIPSNEILSNRPDTETDIKNLFFAGDWVNTDLPSTIESAVKSGRMAAEAVVVNC